MAVIWMVRLLQVYLALGVVFGFAFVGRGARRMDPAARTGTWGFRVLIFPGAVALWPLLFYRWRAAARRTDRAAEGTSA